MSGVDQIMRLADEWYAHGQTSHSGIDEKYAALRAAVEQLAKDAARYRWLRGGSDIPAHSVRWGRWEINCWQGANGWQNLLCSELDAAIDAAREKK